MKDLKIALIWTIWDVRQSLIFRLIELISKRKIIITDASKADLIIYGPYNWDEKFFHLYKFLKKKSPAMVKDFINRYQMGLINKSFFNRKYKPVTLFYNTETVAYNYINADFMISGHLAVDDKRHLSFVFLKEDLNWNNEGVSRDKFNIMSSRYGKYINYDDLLIPQGDFFLKKKRNILFVIGQLLEPRLSIYKIFSKHFIIDGLGRAFNFNHNFKILDLLKDYAFNLCPDHYCIPFSTNSRSAYSFLAKSLPITYLNQSANPDFNPKAFVNLNDHFHDNFEGIISNLKDDKFLKKFTQEPFLLKKPTLNKEIKFVEKIIDFL
jgi:hypothetical protein